MPEISIKPESIFTFFGLEFTNTLLLSLIVLISFFFIARKYNHDANLSNKTTYYYFINFILKSIYNFFYPIMTDKANVFFPLLGGFFFFILLQNWFGLLPGVGSILLKINEFGHITSFPLLRGNESDLNSTISLAVISFLAIQAAGFWYLGTKGYIKKFYNLKNPVSIFTGSLEIVSEFSKIISFAFRLFGNIFAGEVLLTMIAFLVPVIIPFPFLILEIFVGFIQALVFATLTAVFIKVAVTSH